MAHAGYIRRVPEDFIVKCPSCRRPVNGPSPSCPHCRVSLRKLDLKFGVAPKHLGPITDPQVILTASERRRLTKLLALFHSKFPQAKFAVFLAGLPSGTVLSEYAFWLANRMRFSALEATGEANFDLLLVLNTAGNAGLSMGYGLENLVPEEDLAVALGAGREAFAAGRWAAGIEHCVECLTERLRVLCREQK